MYLQQLPHNESIVEDHDNDIDDEGMEESAGSNDDNSHGDDCDELEVHDKRVGKSV